jgi:hypothetical protein
VTVHIDRLISGLNKYWRALTTNEYWRKMDLLDTMNATKAAKFPEDVVDWIWEKKRKPFEVFK